MAAQTTSSDQLSVENMALIRAIETRMQHEIRTEVQGATDRITHMLNEILALLKTAPTKRTTSRTTSSDGASHTVTKPVRKQRNVREIVAYLFEKDLPRALEIFGKVLELTGSLNPLDRTKKPVPPEKVSTYQCTAMKKWCDSNNTTPMYEEIKMKLLQYSEELTRTEELQNATPETDASASVGASGEGDDIVDESDVPNPTIDPDTSSAPAPAEPSDVTDVIAAATTSRVTSTKKPAAPRASSGTTKKPAASARNPAIARM